MLAASGAAVCVVAFWLLALAIHRVLPDSTIDPFSGIVAGFLVAIPIYRALRRTDG
jgi:hypothetical protein